VDYVDVPPAEIHGTWAARDRRIAPRPARRRVTSTASDNRVVGIAVVTVVDAMVDTNGRRHRGRRQPVRRPIHAPGSGHSSVGRWIGDYSRIEDLPTVGDLPSCVPPDRAHGAASPIRLAAASAWRWYAECSQVVLREQEAGGSSAARPPGPASCNADPPAVSRGACGFNKP
jgi:hypothetical protein